MAEKMTKKTASINTKVETIRRFFSDSKATNHPVKDHPISKAEEYVRDLYLDMLCVVAQYECNDTENGFTLIRRIMAACENTRPLEEYIKHSMEITSERTAEFIKQCKDNRLCEIFMIDSMLLSCANGTPNAKQVGFIAQFGDMLGFNKNNMAEIAKFAFAILEQDSDKYQKFLAESNDESIQESILCYAKEFVTGMIICTFSKIYCYSKQLENSDLSEFANVDEVIIENLIFSEYVDCSSIKNLTLIDCKFNKGYIGIYKCDNILLRNCEFNDIEIDSTFSGALKISECQNFEILDCKFNNIYNKGTGNHYYPNCFAGAIFAFKTRGKVMKINNCEFNRCKARGYDSYYNCNYRGAAAFGSDESDTVNISNCHFSSCEGRTLYDDAYTQNNEDVGFCRV